MARAASHITWLDKSLQVCHLDSKAATARTPGEAWQDCHGFQKHRRRGRPLNHRATEALGGHRKILSLP